MSTFTVSEYEAGIAPAIDTRPDPTLKARAFLRVRGEHPSIHEVIIYFLDEETPLPLPKLEDGRGFLFAQRSQYPLFLDLLRHEQQVTCKFVADQLSSGLVSSQARRVIEEGD
jgi:hypothetical protein